MHLYEMLERASRLYPEKVACIDEGRELRYEEVASRVAGVSHFLADRGVALGDRIALMEDNSPEFLEVYFAAASKGAVVCPVNTRLHPREIAQILHHSEASMVVANCRFQDALRSALADAPNVHTIVWIGGRGPDLRKDTVAYDSIPPSNAPVRVVTGERDAIAQIYYTSGSTGEPKGVILTHENVWVHALASIAELQLTDRDVWAHVAPMFHLADAWATFAVTWVGGTHVFVPRFDPPTVIDRFELRRVTITNLVPTMLADLVRVITKTGKRRLSLRLVLSGGAPIAPALVKKVVTCFGCDYVQTYGLTETSPYLTMSVLKGSMKALPSRQRLVYSARTGRPILSVRLRVVNEAGNDVRDDNTEVGEIVASGPTVSPGYWRNEEATRTAFRDGWLRTGDLAVVDGEGFINIVDRKKDVIITGGENVYSTEVESVLYEHRAVKEAAVVGRPSGKWGEEVIAVVALTDSTATTPEDLIAHCQQYLAEFKIPRVVIIVDALPRTGSGKISKRRLRQELAPGTKKPR